MLGDGVNDVPALKQARLAIAQGSGTQMARSVSDLVLVRGEFGEVPRMVARGPADPAQHPARRAAVRDQGGVHRRRGDRDRDPDRVFPLLPRQFTLASSLTIGVPAFLLALAPTSGPWRPEGFLQSVARFSIPAGIAIGIGILAGYLLARYAFDRDLEQARTVATGSSSPAGSRSCMRSSESRAAALAVIALCAVMALLFLVALVRPVRRDFFDLATPTGEAVAPVAAAASAGCWRRSASFASPGSPFAAGWSPRGSRRTARRILSPNEHSNGDDAVLSSPTRRPDATRQVRVHRVRRRAPPYAASP